MFYSKNKELCITNEELCIKNDELCRGRHHGRNFAWCDFSIDFQLFLDCILKVFDCFSTASRLIWVNFGSILTHSCEARLAPWRILHVQRGMAPGKVSKNDELCIKIEELFIKNDEFCRRCDWVGYLWDGCTDAASADVPSQ